MDFEMPIMNGILVSSAETNIYVGNLEDPKVSRRGQN
jgi:hypothetical protein